MRGRLNLRAVADLRAKPTCWAMDREIVRPSARLHRCGATMLRIALFHSDCRAPQGTGLSIKTRLLPVSR